MRIAIVSAGVFLVLTAASVPLAASDPNVDALRKQVEGLEARLKSLEIAVQALAAARTAPMPAVPAPAVSAPPSAAAPSAAASAATSPNYEEEAQAIIQEVIQATDQGDPERARAKLAELRTRYGASKVAGQGSYFSNEIEVIGKSAPADWGITSWFQGPDQIDLSAKPTTLVVFWEEWCPHCRDEMPKLQSLYADYKKKGLQLLGLTKVTQTSTDEKVTAYLKQIGVQFPVGKEAGTPSSYFNVKGIPAAAILKNGKIVWRGHPIRVTPEILQRFL